MGSPGSSDSKETAYNVGAAEDTGSIPGWGRFPGEGHSNPLQFSCLENPMDRGAGGLQSIRSPKSWTRLKRLNTHTQSLNIDIVYEAVIFYS